MKHLLILFIIIPLLTACEDSENKTTELEGLWKTECIGPFSEFTTIAEQKSHTITMNFTGSYIDTNIKTFTDNQCSILESTAPASEPNSLFTENNIAISFTIGESITASNGLPAKEIDLTLNNGKIQLSIYQLQDNGSSLYIAPCLQQVQTQGTLNPGGDTTHCINERSIEISFSLKYIKQ